jgi:hypothetical protein
MKFYTENKHSYVYWNKIADYKLTAIYFSKSIWFLKDGKSHNNKNSCFIKYDGSYNDFYLNGIYYGDHNKFNKISWRRFVKLQVFL